MGGAQTAGSARDAACLSTCFLQRRGSCSIILSNLATLAYLTTISINIYTLICRCFYIPAKNYTALSCRLQDSFIIITGEK